MSNDATLLLVNKHVVDQLLVPDDVIAVVREAFELHGQRAGRVFPVVREQLSKGGIFGISVFDMTGLALQDLTVARLIHRRATKLGVGVTVAWPW